MSTPEQMRAAVARYVEEIHRAYVAQAMTFPAAVRGQMPLLAGGPLTVAGVGTVVYHFVASPGAGLSAHNAAHVGTGLAGGHSAAARDFETIRSRVRGR